MSEIKAKQTLTSERERMSRDHFGFLNTRFQDSLKSLSYFELKSLIGRFLFPLLHRYERKKYLHIGCGGKLFENFTNVDFFNKSLFSRNPKPEVMHDLRFPLPFPDNSFDGAFSEHTLEHFYPQDCLNLLQEIYRVTKKGGIFRISLPDVSKAIEAYNNNSFPSRHAVTRGEMLNFEFRYGHRAVYDPEFMIYLLEIVGFNGKVHSYLDGLNKELCVESPEREQHSFYVEGTKD